MLCCLWTAAAAAAAPGPELALLASGGCRVPSRAQHEGRDGPRVRVVSLCVEGVARAAVAAVPELQRRSNGAAGPCESEHAAWSILKATLTRHAILARPFRPLFERTTVKFPVV